MDQLPLIAKRISKDKHDAASIIRNSFQDILTKYTVPKNVLENVKKKQHGSFIMKKESKSNDGITIDGTEWKTMANHAFLLNKLYFISDDPLTKYNNLLQLPDLEPDYEPKIVDKYGLIQKKDLDMNIIQKTLDFRYNKNIKCGDESESECSYEILKKRRRKQKPKDQKAKVFEAKPEIIVFADYELNVTYKKRFTLRNVTNKAAPLYIKTSPKSNKFVVQSLTSSSRLAPGVTARYEVTFKSDEIVDLQDCVVFRAYTGCDVRINLICYRIAPCLRTYVFKSIDHFLTKPLPNNSSADYDVGRSTALNLVVDFGTCFLGNKISITLIMQNEGNTGSFFIITESEWFNSELFNINCNMSLTLNNFHLHPIYFTVERRSIIEMDIQFFPTETGLHVENLYILCDNNTYECIDIIGDAISFSPEMVNVQIPHLGLKSSINDETADYSFECGMFLPFYWQTKTLVIGNYSCLDLKFRCEIRHTCKKNKYRCVKLIDPEWIKIESIDYLPAYVEVPFPISISCQTFEDGLYSGVLVLIVEDIPEISLEDGLTFTILEKDPPVDESPKLVDVIVGEIELLVDLCPYSVEITPQSYIYPDVLKFNEVLEDTIRISTAGILSINCKWNIPKDFENMIEIKPMKFKLTSSMPVNCEIAIIVEGYKDIDANIILVIEDGVLSKTLKIVVKVDKPFALFTTHNLYLGIIPKGTLHFGKLTVQSKSHEDIDWLVMEIFYCEKEKKFVEINCQCHLSITEGHLSEYDETQDIIYMINAHTNIHWVSFLVLISSHPLCTAMKSMCIINYHVMSPKVQIHTIGSEFPIECPNQLLHKNICSLRKILLQNYCDMTVCFIWGKPFGKQAEFVDLKFSPKSGVLKPHKGVCMDLYLTPLKLGIFEEIFVPCFVGRMEKPLILRILCAVEDIYVNFYIPKRDGTFDIVAWPPQMIDEFDMDLPEYEIIQHGEEQEFVKIKEWCLCDGDMKFKCRCQHMSVESATPPPLSEIILTYLKKYEKSAMQFGEEAGTYKAYSTLSYCSEKSDSHCSYCPENLKNYISNDLKYLENVIECFKVPLRTAIKKTIYIENLTPALGEVRIESNNFYGTDVNKKETIMEEALSKLKIKKTDYKYNNMNDDGVLVTADPSITKINGHEKIQIDIYIYATTWGVYLDEISIDINEILPFCFNLLIEVVGIPIEFPLAANTILSEPTLRFGSLTYKVGSSTRRIKVCNTSEIPICVVWHIFLCNESIDGTPVKNYFNVLFDVLKADEHSDLNIPNLESKFLITKEYYGKKTSKVFQLQQTESYLKKKSSGYIEITFDFNKLDGSFNCSEIHAYLIGIIHLADEFRYQAELYRRPSCCEIEPAKLKLTVNIQRPLLIVEQPSSDFNISFKAYEVFNKRTLTIVKNIVYLVTKSDTNISMKVDEPFNIVQLETVTTSVSGDSTIFVQQNEHLEVTINCKLNDLNILEISSFMYDPSDPPENMIVDKINHCVTIQTPLDIQPGGITEQPALLECTIYYPFFTVKPTVLDYGMVYVGASVKRLVTLSNKSAQEMSFAFCTDLGRDGIIIFKPNAGILEPYEDIIVSIYFAPKEVKRYEEIISILTFLPKCTDTVTLQGYGTCNEKFLFKELN